MAYDAALHEVILFGGLDTNYNTLGDTWAFNGTAWSKLLPASTVSARSDAMMVYDSSLGKLVLFGGILSSGDRAAGHLDLQRQPWQKLTLGTKPLARTDAAMAYDSAVSQVVLFGGLDSTGVNTLDDTWEFNWIRLDTGYALDTSAGEVLRRDGLRPVDESSGPLRRARYFFEHPR